MSDQAAFLKAIADNPECETTRLVYADWLDEHDMPVEAAYYRGGLDTNETEFRSASIAQADSGGYDPSGYVACVFKRGTVTVAALVQFSHCSCYGTWTAITSNDHQNPRWDWIGLPDELVAMARREADPVMPARPIADDDYNAGHLRDIYRQVLEWDTNGRPVKEPPPKMGCGSREAMRTYNRCYCEVCESSK